MWFIGKSRQNQLGSPALKHSLMSTRCRANVGQSTQYALGLKDNSDQVANSVSFYKQRSRISRSRHQLMGRHRRYGQWAKEQPNTARIHFTHSLSVHSSLSLSLSLSTSHTLTTADGLSGSYDGGKDPSNLKGPLCPNSQDEMQPYRLCLICGQLLASLSLSISHVLQH